jgi:hypothetical protein
MWQPQPPIATATIKNNASHRKLGLLNRGPTFHGFNLFFVLGGDVTTAPPEAPEAPIACFCELVVEAGYYCNYHYYAKPHVDLFCFVWTMNFA